MPDSDFGGQLSTKSWPQNPELGQVSKLSKYVRCQIGILGWTFHIMYLPPPPKKNAGIILKTFTDDILSVFRYH